MNIVRKLKTIQKLSGLSQEKLAQKFAVSFATFNSWINGKSIPRQKAQQQIEGMYLDITGQKVVPADELAAKKQVVEKKLQEHPDVLNGETGTVKKLYRSPYPAFRWFLLFSDNFN